MSLFRRKTRGADFTLTHAEAFVLWRALEIYRKAPLAAEPDKISRELQRRVKVACDAADRLSRQEISV